MERDENPEYIRRDDDSEYDDVSVSCCWCLTHATYGGIVVISPTNIIITRVY